MKINVYLSGNPTHDRVLRAFQAGCGGQLRAVEEYEPSEVAVIFGVYKSRVPQSFARGEVFRQQREKNLDVIVLETGYINRGDGEAHHYAAGFNGLNGRADFRNQGMPDDRALLLRKEHGLRCLAWRETGKHVLLCGQVPWDASVEMCENYPEWLKHITRRIRHHTDREIRFRPHPLGPDLQIPGCSHSTVPLAEDLNDCWATVSFNSNTGVESVIDGIPTFAFDEGAMAKGMANMWLADLENPKTPDRHQWLNDLAYTQWTPEEMKKGLTWRHLFR